MRQTLIHLKRFEWFFELVDCACKSQVILMFYGRMRRSHRVDNVLKKWECTHKLKAVWHNGYKVYFSKRTSKGNPNIDHALGVTDCAVRFHHSGGKIIPVRRNSPTRADLGVNFSESELRVEFCTENQSQRLGILKNKIRHYQFTSYPVLFVMDTTREKVKEFATSDVHGQNIYFTDFETFKRVPLGRHLVEPIYFMDDGKEWPLK